MIFSCPFFSVIYLPTPTGCKGFVMKMKYCALTLFSLMFNLHAAEELSPEKAEKLKPFKNISITGHFVSIGDAAKAVSKRADGLGAAYFYIQSMSEGNRGDNTRVIANLYHADAEVMTTEPKHREFNGIKELAKKDAHTLQPFDTVTVNGYFPNQASINDAISKLAKQKSAASFFIVRQIGVNNKGDNQIITAYVYKADAPRRVIQRENAIPANSAAGAEALAKGGTVAEKVEIPGVASSSTVGVGRFFETQSTQNKRYAVTLADGTQIEEINVVTAAQMVPFDSITFSGNFLNITEISEAVAKRAAEKGAKFYHITNQLENNHGGTQTISADLFK